MCVSHINMFFIQAIRVIHAGLLSFFFFANSGLYCTLRVLLLWIVFFQFNLFFILWHLLFICPKCRWLLWCFWLFSGKALKLAILIALHFGWNNFWTTLCFGLVSRISCYIIGCIVAWVFLTNKTLFKWITCTQRAHWQTCFGFRRPCTIILGVVFLFIIVVIFIVFFAVIICTTSTCMETTSIC